MATAPAQDVVHRFCGWELRPAQRQLLVDRESVEIGSRAFDLLLVLIEHRARVISKAELLAAVWPGRVVEENNISVQIATLRKLLGAHSIATIPGIGYRLSAEPAPAAAPEHESAGASAGAVDATRLQAGASLKQQNTLYGRDDDLAAVLALLGQQPVLSITGSGGVGKTTLARSVLARHAEHSGEEVLWVDLTLHRAGENLVSVVASNAGVLGADGDEVGDLLLALSRSRTLIALDNCEHVIEEVVSLIRRALEAAPGVRWVVTSQVPLHLREECVYQLQPLRVPAPDAEYAGAVRSGAVALLRARVAAAYRPFDLTPQNIRRAVALCRRLDGLPLAIEMAASRVATLGLDDVVEQLDHKLGLSGTAAGSPIRQQTLRRTFDWSYGLLSPVEQRVFRCLEPFVGGFSARMVRQICCDVGADVDGPQAWEVLEALSVLVERSLVQRLSDGSARYVLYESARDYARMLLREAGEAAEIRGRHAQILAEHFSAARSDHDRMRDADWAVRYLPERSNLRAALAWACEERDPDLLARLVAALAQIDNFSRSHAEVVHSGVPMDTLLQAQPVWRAAACVEFGWAHFLDGDRRVGTTLTQQAVQDFRALGDTAGSYQALAQLIRLCESRPDQMGEARQAARDLAAIDESRVPLRCQLFRGITAGLQYAGERTVARLRELHDLAQRSGFDTLAAVCRVHITDQLLIDGRFADVVDEARRFDPADEPRPRVRATLMVNLVLALVQLGRVSEASEPAREVLRTLPSAAYQVVASFALAAAREGRHEDAACMIGFSERVRYERDQRADPAEAASDAEVIDRLTKAMEPVHLAELRRLGGALSLDDVWSFIP